MPSRNMGYKSKKPKDLKLKKTLHPPSDYNKSIFDFDDSVSYDKKIIDYLGSRKRNELPVWTANYPYSDFKDDIARFSNPRSSNMIRDYVSVFTPSIGYKILSSLSRKSRFPPGV